LVRSPARTIPAAFRPVTAASPLIAAWLVRFQARGLNRASNERDEHMKQDVYEKITLIIVADLEQGVPPWLQS
jgi:hypothetical protein